MVFGWFKSRRRRKIVERPFPDAWVKVLAENFRHWEFLDEPQRARLCDIIHVLIEEKNWQGCGGLELTDEIRVSIAAQAALLLLGIEHDYYDNVHSILVYPSGYILPRTRIEQGGVVRDEQAAVLGSAHQGGPVVLSWDSALGGGRNPHDGKNVVYHEFAHKLDMLDGIVDGTPELEDAAEFEAWVRVMTDAFEQLRNRSRQGKKTLLDAYGATDVGEFFAVATEVFFEKPRQMRGQHPDLYAVLQDFYGQDPASRVR
jgi:Mlc titration factor MtfA (ptsG expression regulator)